MFDFIEASLDPTPLFFNNYPMEHLKILQEKVFSDSDLSFFNLYLEIQSRSL